MILRRNSRGIGGRTIRSPGACYIKSRVPDFSLTHYPHQVAIFTNTVPIADQTISTIGFRYRNLPNTPSSGRGMPAC